MTKVMLRRTCGMLALLVLICMVRPVSASHTIDQGQCGDDVTWHLSSDGTLTLSGTGMLWYYTYGYAGPSDARTNIPWFPHRTNIKRAVIEEGITHVQQGIFYKCTNMTSVSIPSSVTYIGMEAFQYCESLTTITIPEGVEGISESAFYGCKSLKTVTFPDSLTWMGDFAFFACTGLETITTPKNVRVIQTGIFSLCESLKKVIISENVVELSKDIFIDLASLEEIVFLGSAPSTANNFLDGTNNVTAYHSCTDTTWTPEVKQSYGGNVTWVGHLFGEYTDNRDATCTKDGTMTRKCLQCDATQTKTFPGTALEHELSNDGMCIHCHQAPAFVINMRDAYGDGWNGAAISVYADDVHVTDLTLTDGSADQAAIPNDPCKTYTFQWTSGRLPTECSFDILVGEKLLLQGSGGDDTSGQTIFTYSNQCDHAYETQITPPTCTTEGFATNTCTICNKTNRETLEVTPHNFVDGQCACGLLKGDVTGDGKLNMGDVAQLFAHVRGKTLITDETRLLCADVNGDGKINMGDVAKTFAQVKQ